MDVGDVAARDREREHAERDDAVEQSPEPVADLASVRLCESSESIDPARFRAMAVFCEREA